MSLGYRRFVTVVLGLALQKAAGAQRLATAPIDSGTVIRMHLANAQTVRGRLLQTFTPSTSALTFCRYPGTPCATLSDPHVQTVPALQVTGLDVAQGTHLVKGAMIGGAIGGLLAFVYFQFGHGLCDTSRCISETDRGALGAFGLGLGLGVAFGSQSVKWRPVGWRPGP